MNSINYEKFKSTSSTSSTSKPDKTYKFTLFGSGHDYKDEPTFVVHYSDKSEKVVVNKAKNNPYKDLMKGTARTSNKQYFDYNFKAPIDKITSTNPNIVIMAINGVDIPEKNSGKPYCGNLYFGEDGRINATYYNKKHIMTSHNYAKYTSDCKPLCCPDAKTNKFQCNGSGKCDNTK